MRRDQPEGPNRSETIVTDIGNRRGPESGQVLMEFVDDGGKQHECYCLQFGLNDVRLLVLKAPVGENRKNEVLGDVPEFSNNGVPKVDFVSRESREEECQDRHDDPGSFSGSECIRREKENEDQPDDERSPIFNDEFFH